MTSVTWLEPVPGLVAGQSGQVVDPRLEIELRAPFPAFNKDRVLQLVEHV